MSSDKEFEGIFDGDEVEPVTGAEQAQGEEKTITLKVSEHQKLLDEIAALKDKHVRLYAEFENVRKRNDRERIEFVKYANQELLVDFLDILDDLERSVEAARASHQDYAAFLKGVEMVMAHVYDLLKKNDVQPIEAKGKIFDPHCHEALMQEERDDLEEGTVIEEFQRGYTLGSCVIRTNKVKVAKKKESCKDVKDGQG